MPGDEPSFVVVPGELDERGSQFFDGIEGPHPQQVLLQESHGEVDSDRHFGRVRLLPPTLEATMQTVADRPEAPMLSVLILALFLSRWNSVDRHG